MTAPFLLGVLARAGGWRSGAAGGSAVDDQAEVDVLAAWDVAPLMTAVGSSCGRSGRGPRPGALAAVSVAVGVAAILQEVLTGRGASRTGVSWRGLRDGTR
jgi:hypothetical protein